MEIIYVDSLFLTNFVIDYFLLLLTGRVSGFVLRRGCIAWGAALGGLYAAAVLLPPLRFLQTLPLKLCAAAAMMLTAYGREKHLFRGMGIFLLIAATFGGTASAAALHLGLRNGAGLYIPVSAKVLVLSFGCCYGALLLLMNRRGKRAEREVREVTVQLGGETIRLRALLDTGNTLCDPVSGRAVLVAEAEALWPVLGLPMKLCGGVTDPAALLCRLNTEPCLAGRLRLVPYAALGNPGGLLPAIRPDAVHCGTENLDVLVALTPDALCADGEYNAIL